MSFGQFSVALPIEVVASGGIPVRQVDLNGAALDDSTYVYSVALPVMPVSSSGVNENSSLIFSTWRKVTLDPNGIPIVRVDAFGTAVATPLGGTNPNRTGSLGKVLLNATVSSSALLGRFASARPTLANATLSSTATSTATLSTPSLSLFSSAGASPLVLQWSDADYTAGMRGQLQIASDSGFSTLLQNLVFFIDGEDWSLNDTSVGLSTPSGLYYARIRALRDDENGTAVTGTDPMGNAVSFNAVTSAWSNTVTDTISASTASFNTANGVNKNQWAVVSGTPKLIVTGTTGQGGAVRTTAEQASSKAQFEFTVTSLGTSSFKVAIDNGTMDLNSTSGIPGYGNANGVAVQFAYNAHTTSSFDEIQIWWGAGFSGGIIGSFGANIVQVNDTFTIEYDYSANSMTVYRTRSGTTTTIGTRTGINALTHYYVAAQPANTSTTLTFNFGGSAWVKAPGTGVANIWA